MQPQLAPGRRDTASIVAALLVFVGALIVVVGVPQADSKLRIRSLTGGSGTEVLWPGRGFGAEDLFLPVLPVAIGVVCAILGLALARGWLTALAGVPSVLLLVFGIYFALTPNDPGTNLVISWSIASGTVMLLVGTALMVIGAVIALVRELQARRTASAVVEAS